MILAALALLAQEVPAPAPAPAPAADAVEGEDIVVRATFGRTTMLFDKGADGKLRNCRIMVSSGSQKRDTDACQATPVCYARTADEVTDCRELSVLEQAAIVAPPAPGAGKAEIFALPKLVQPKPAASAATIGPAATTEESRETERQRVKLPPLPKDESNGPVVRFGASNTGKSDNTRDNTQP